MRANRCQLSPCFRKALSNQAGWLVSSNLDMKIIPATVPLVGCRINVRQLAESTTLTGAGNISWVALKRDRRKPSLLSVFCDINIREMFPAPPSDPFIDNGWISLQKPYRNHLATRTRVGPGNISLTGHLTISVKRAASIGLIPTFKIGNAGRQRCTKLPRLHLRKDAPKITPVRFSELICDTLPAQDSYSWDSEKRVTAPGAFRYQKVSPANCFQAQDAPYSKEEGAE